MEFQCCHCGIELNQTERIPLVVPSCGHSACQVCVMKYVNGESVLQCTEDGIQCDTIRDLKCFPHNQSIIALLKKQRGSIKVQTQIYTPDDQNNRNSTKEVSEFSSEKSISQSQSTESLPKQNICQLHQKELELVCQEDGQLICVNCALFGPHKLHNYLPIEQYCKQIEQAVNEISEVYKQLQNNINSNEQLKQQIIKGLLLQQNQIKSFIDIEFNDLIKQIEEIKNNIIQKIDQNFRNANDLQISKMDIDFNNWKQETDKWLKDATIQLTLLTDEKTTQKCRKHDQQIIRNGKQLLIQFDNLKENIDNTLIQTQQQQDVHIPIQMIINYMTKIVGLHKTKSDKIKTEFIQPLEQIQEEKDLIRKMDQSDFLLDDKPVLEESLILQQQKQSLQIDVVKNHRHSTLISQSQQPTQPASPSQDMTKSMNFNSTQQNFQPHRLKERSITISSDLLDISQVALKLSKFNNNSNQKQQQKKFTNNSKMNDKLSNGLSIIHQDKTEIIDLSQIDFNDQIIAILDDYIKGKQVLKVLKMNKCKLTDDLLNKLLPGLAETKITTLHLQQNSLTEKCLDHILTHLRQIGQLPLKVIYLNSNILTAIKAKRKIDELKKIGIQIQI